MRKLIVHICFWLLFFLVWEHIMYFYIDNSINRLYFALLDFILIVVAFYTVYLIIIPLYLKNKSLSLLFLSGIALVIALFGLFSGLMQILLHHGAVPIHFNFSWNYKDLQYNKFFVALLGVLAGCFVKLAIDRMEVSRKMEELQKERSLAELTYLKAQINPHFLFNSLNNLYSLMDADSATAKNTLSSLSDLLRYQLYDSNTGFILLSKEIAYLQNYFSLQSIRKENCLTELLIPQLVSNLYITPMLLIPFVENAFKYVSDFDDKDNFIRCKLHIEGRELIFKCENTFDKTSYPVTDGEYNGIGLPNVKKRLELIYPGRHQLHITKADQTYTVNLTITLHDA